MLKSVYYITPHISSSSALWIAAGEGKKKTHKILPKVTKDLGSLMPGVRPVENPEL